jgi:membrane protease YdiL (CAAX protease family)
MVLDHHPRLDQCDVEHHDPGADPELGPDGPILARHPSHERRLSALIKKHPAISQMVLGMLMGGGMIAPMIAALAPTDSMFLLVTAYSARLAGVILTAIVSGKAGLRAMFARLLIWRVGIGWWLFSLLALLLMFLAMLLGYLMMGSSLSLSRVPPLYMFIPGFIIKMVLDAGLGEELAWCGSLLPRLQARLNALVSSIIVGIVWGLCYLPLFMLEGMPPYYELG